MLGMLHIASAICWPGALHCNLNPLSPVVLQYIHCELNSNLLWSFLSHLMFVYTFQHQTYQKHSSLTPFPWSWRKSLLLVTTQPFAIGFLVRMKVETESDGSSNNLFFIHSIKNKTTGAIVALNSPSCEGPNHLK